jgi:carbamate kinase
MVKQDAGRGWRRVVPSPRPKRILDYQAIGHLAREGYLVVACGGGGIPVIEDEKGEITGVEAVIDKDFASSLLARSIGADLFLVSTGVERVAIDWGKPTQRWLDRMSVAEAKRHLADDQFDKGSMGPKIEAAIEFVAGAGNDAPAMREALITSPDHIGRALAGRTGTRISRE